MEDSGIDSDSKSTVYSENIAQNELNFDSTKESNSISPLPKTFPSVGSSFIPNESIKCSSSSRTEINSVGAYGEVHEVDTRNKTNLFVEPEFHSSQPPRLLNTSQLQKRLERQIQEAKKIRQQVKDDANETQKRSLIPRNRLSVPSKQLNSNTLTNADEQPLVSWESDSSDDGFEFHSTRKVMDKEITHQLKKDGYNLDLTPDDEDLDLIPPKPLNERCSCCVFNSSCCLM